MTKAGSGPKTAAERQRAYRERQKRSKGVVLPKLPPANDPEAPPDDDEEQPEVSVAELNARMRQIAARTLTEVGGVEYLKRVAKKSPGTFLRFAAQFVTKDETINPGAFNIIVQKLTIEAAQPVPGVLASPVAGHIAPPRVMLPPADVVDAESRDA